jgi:phosphoribosylamine--glycine ligase
MAKLTVLVVGSGGREHALTWALARSPQVKQIFVAPGNAGTAELATNVPIGSSNINELVVFAAENEVALTIVGPEAPLAAGIVDVFQTEDLAVFGPSWEAARLESSKAFAKAFMRQHRIPTAAYETFTDYEAARQYLEQRWGQNETAGVVVKASGLAAGKGVIVCDSVDEAQTALQQIMVERAFGAAGDEVVIEERLRGEELSLLAFSDGRTVVPMLPARDHKPVYDNDEGPNTGGMGAYAPPPGLDQVLVDEVVDRVLQPAVAGMAQRQTPYVGVLYAGLMLTADGPRVLEFNCRFGDPETQVILPMLDADLAEIMLDCIDGRLDANVVRRRPGACAAVVMAAPGYPGQYRKGLPVAGVTEVAASDDVLVFQAGTKQNNGRLVTDGGRVLAVSALGEDLETAVQRAYEGVGQIHFEGAHYRTDIGREPKG